MIASLFLAVFGALFALSLFAAIGAKPAPPSDPHYTKKELDPKTASIGAAVIFGLIFFVLLAMFSNVMIKNQHVGYVTVFGVVQKDRIIREGIHLKWPWEKVSQVSTAMHTMTFSGSSDKAKDKPVIVGLTKDPVELMVDLAVSWTPIGGNVPAFKSKYGLNAEYDDQVYSIIRSAVRDTISATTWRAASVQDRKLFEEQLRASIERKTEQFFKENGFGERSDQMVTYGAVNLRNVLPPEDIRAENNLLAATQIKEQTQIAMQRVVEQQQKTREAQARNNNALVRIPEGMTAEQYALVLNATTGQLTADTFRDAVENDKPVTVVVGVGTTPTVVSR